MRLVVYEEAECYRTTNQLNRTKMVSQLERRFYPYLEIHHCFTTDKPRFELTLDKLNNEIITRSFTNLQNDFDFLAKHITDNLGNHEKIINKPFMCPRLKRDDPDRPRHEVYHLLHTRSHLKPISDEARHQANIEVCKDNFGRNTDLYDHCVLLSKIPTTQKTEHFFIPHYHNTYNYVGILIIIIIVIHIYMQKD